MFDIILLRKEKEVIVNPQNPYHSRDSPFERSPFEFDSY